jgi:cytoskeleton protein RodZ
MARKTKESIQDTFPKSVQTVEATTMNLDNVQTDSTINSHSDCGGALRLARESQKLSIQEIATRLRLSTKQIEAIEADNFVVLPEPTIVRGFIRNYAKQLKIASEPLLDAYSVMVPTIEPHGMIVKPSANMKMTSYQKPKTGLYTLVGLAILLGLGIWLFYQNYVQKPSPTKQIANMGSVESLPLPEPALPAAEREGALQASTELTLPAAADVNTLPVENSTPVASVPVTDVPVPVPANATPTSNSTTNNNVTSTMQPATVTEKTVTPPVTPSSAGMAKLEFSANQETWVSVIDATGKEVYSKTIFAGSRESINVILPVNVTVGNSGATSLSMNGKSYDLAPYSRNNVAHIKLDK